MFEPKKISKTFAYTSVFDTEIEFNDTIDWRDQYVKIKIKTENGYLKLNDNDVNEFEFQINGIGECRQLKMALLHFAYILETEIMPR